MPTFIHTYSFFRGFDKYERKMFADNAVLSVLMIMFLGLLFLPASFYRYGYPRERSVSSTLCCADYLICSFST